jgi:holo-[acyl-carrier protein] synthase
MRIHGIGIDVVEVSRIAAAIGKHGELFLARIFTAAERDYCSAQKNPEQHFAARFAAKEAVAKALGTGIGEHAGWVDLEIHRSPTGAPVLRLHGAAARFAGLHGISAVQISLTHAKDYAAANAVAVGPPSPADPPAA